MRDAERIYALYVQANPVPDPDLLDMTRDETVLLPIERSDDMITQEPIQESPRVRPSRRNVLVAAGVFAAILVVGLATVLLVNGGESGPVAAADARPEVVFDGATCTYDGPSEIEAGNVEFTMINSAAREFTLGGFRMEGEALEAALIKIPVGTDLDVRGDPPPAGRMSLNWTTDPGSTGTGVATFVAGTYLIDCATWADGSTDHVWRAARIDVISP